MIVGQTVKLGYYAQEIASERPEDGSQERGIDFSYMDPEQRVIDYVKDTAEYIRTADGADFRVRHAGTVFISPGEAVQPHWEVVRGEKKRLNLPQGSRQLAELPDA